MSSSLERHDRRAFFRVRTRIALGMRHVVPAEIADLCTEILRGAARSDAPLDPALVDRLARIEEKLDLLLARSGAAAPPALTLEERTVVLSGSGLLLPELEALPEIGSSWLLEIDLPLSPRHRVRCIARVSGTRADEDGTRALALSFTCIHENDRAAIVRHGLAVQRAELERRAQGAAEPA